MRSAFVLVGPIRCENLVSLPAEQQIEFLIENAVDLFAERLIEVRHSPAAELEALGRILRWPAGRLHDAVGGNLGTDDNLPHRARSSANQVGSPAVRLDWLIGRSSAAKPVQPVCPQA